MRQFLRRRGFTNNTLVGSILGKLLPFTSSFMKLFVQRQGDLEVQDSSGDMPGEGLVLNEDQRVGNKYKGMTFSGAGDVPEVGNDLHMHADWDPALKLSCC